jgi:hypothetical protein
MRPSDSSFGSFLKKTFLTSTLGTNFDPQGRSCPQGWILSPRGEVIPWGWNSLLRGWTTGWTFPPRGQISPLGAKFSHRGKRRPWGNHMLLKRAYDLSWIVQLLKHVLHRTSYLRSVFASSGKEFCFKTRAQQSVARSRSDHDRPPKFFCKKSSKLPNLT